MSIFNKNRYTRRNQMKKILSVLTAILLCLSFSGCAGSSKNSGSQSAVSQVDYTSSKISYLGPAGTYTQEACERFFDGQGAYLPCETVNDAVKALVDKKSDYAVIPQENTIGGAVVDYIDALITQPEVSVAGEVELSISQNLLVVPGTSLNDIKTVYSHRQGIEQGRQWLEKNLPGAELVEVSSTARGAEMVSEGNDKSCAAVASAGCAQVYNLEILAAGIQNNDNNKTRFYVLSLKEPSKESSDRLAFTATGSASDLPKFLEKTEDLDITLVTIHDRPEKTELGSYCYVIECENCDYKTYLKLADNKDFELRYLGSFPLR